MKLKKFEALGLYHKLLSKTQFASIPVSAEAMYRECSSLERFRDILKNINIIKETLPKEFNNNITYLKNALLNFDDGDADLRIFKVISLLAKDLIPNSEVSCQEWAYKGCYIKRHIRDDAYISVKSLNVFLPYVIFDTYKWLWMIGLAEYFSNNPVKVLNDILARMEVTIIPSAVIDTEFTCNTAASYTSSLETCSSIPILHQSIDLKKYTELVKGYLNDVCITAASVKSLFPEYYDFMYNLYKSFPDKESMLFEFVPVYPGARTNKKSDIYYKTNPNNTTCKVVLLFSCDSLLAVQKFKKWCDVLLTSTVSILNKYSCPLTGVFTNGLMKDNNNFIKFEREGDINMNNFKDVAQAILEFMSKNDEFIKQIELTNAQGKKYVYSAESKLINGIQASSTMKYTVSETDANGRTNIVTDIITRSGVENGMRYFQKRVNGRWIPCTEEEYLRLNASVVNEEDETDDEDYEEEDEEDEDYEEDYDDEDIDDEDEYDDEDADDEEEEVINAVRTNFPHFRFENGEYVYRE